jgi:arylsulfatase A-like enzyme
MRAAASVVFAVVAAARASAAPVSAASAARPNVLFILADDQGWGDATFNAPFAVQPGAGGARFTPNPPRTPHLDALAASASTLVFDRFYSGSPVCSPTRASLLTGRTPDRECVFNAEGCGQLPAWACVNPQPFPGGWAVGASEIFTAADAAAAAGYATLHAGKWHLGDFFPKKNPSPSYAYKKWPVSTPGHAGFAEWFSTEASASSTMCNCGCDAAWPAEPPGCVIGGGVYVMNKSFPCTNYWAPSSNASSGACAFPSRATLSCVDNSTEKIPGDDSLFQLARFERFVDAAAATARPWFATLQLHTNHIPHPALPEFFYAYNDTDGVPAGDYRGTLTQMDNAIGALVASLAARGALDNTLLWYAADNGPHPGRAGDGAGGIRVKNTATNGLRQCKASVFEGGIRVPAFVSWPGVISANARTSVPAYVPDFLPTLLDILGAAHPRPGFASDGESLLPLLRGAAFARARPLAWRLGAQVALLDAAGRYKYVRAPDAGQCDADAAPYDYKDSPFLFDVIADPTESAPLADAARLAAMDAAARAWEATIATSQVNESACLPGAAPAGAPALLRRAGAGCLAAASVAKHAALTDAGACAPAADATWTVGTGGALALAADATWCAHADAAVPCAAGVAIWLGQEGCAGGALALDAAAGTLRAPNCPGLCAARGAGGALALAPCAEAGARGWATEPVGARGRYAAPLD